MIVDRLISEILFGFTGLMGIINPFGIAFLFLERTESLTEAQRAALARKVAINAFIVLLAAFFVGTPILHFFGISLEALRIGGGLAVAVAGWQMLNEPDVPTGGDTAAQPVEPRNAMARAFFPLTIPLTTGPGSIATAIALNANRTHKLSEFVLSGRDARVGVPAAVRRRADHAHGLLRVPAADRRSGEVKAARCRPWRATRRAGAKRAHREGGARRAGRIDPYRFVSMASRTKRVRHGRMRETPRDRAARRAARPRASVKRAAASCARWCARQAPGGRPRCRRASPPARNARRARPGCAAHAETLQRATASIGYVKSPKCARFRPTCASTAACNPPAR